MNLTFNKNLADSYTSFSQIARVLTENWVKENSYCPNCGRDNISEYPNNQPVADFFCAVCLEDFELKAKHGALVTERHLMSFDIYKLPLASASGRKFNKERL